MLAAGSSWSWSSSRLHSALNQARSSGSRAQASTRRRPSGEPSSRAAFTAALQGRKLHGLCVYATAAYGNAASRLAEHVPSTGTYAYGGYPDIDALYKEQALVTDKKKREARLHQIQRLVHERVRFGPMWEYIWPSGVGPRVEEPALMLINPYPWAAPLEEVRLKKK